VHIRKGKIHYPQNTIEMQMISSIEPAPMDTVFVKVEVSSGVNEFKKQIVALYINGKKTKDLVNKNGISPAAVYKWSNEYSNS
jgi:hypothetical protein